MVELVEEKLQSNSIEQYKKEVRSGIVKRILSDHERFEHLMRVMKADNISPQKNFEYKKILSY